MASLSNYLKNALRNHITQGTAYTMPAGLWVTLYTSNPTAADTGTEVTGTGYARVNIAPGAGQWTTTTDGFSDNIALVAFGAPTANWGTITHVGVRDANTGGNLLFFDALDTPEIINNGDPAPEIPVGGIDIQFA